MTPDDMQKIAALFDAARALPVGARRAYLDEACGGTRQLRAEVESLLAHHDAESNILSDGVGADVLQSVARELLEDLAKRPGGGAARVEKTRALPAQIGGYRVIREVGIGGMGVVYEAEQENPRRRVALKMLRSAIASPMQLRRFQLEAQVLGEMQHPGIAQIYEAGDAEAGGGGHPYFAMEFIDGVPLVRHAEASGLAVRQRLALFAQVCDAVQYAHGRGVVHRDLKPANILVDRADRAKILDFGVARVTSGDIQLTQSNTDAGQVIGTLPYMSPEQVAGEPAAIDFRCDVYALGVILFELLTGQLPYDLSRQSIAKAVQIIQEREPLRLGSVDKSLRGDLDTIVSKAIEKDKDRRYLSAAELAADVRRFLADEPILARPATAMYQLRKFTRRNKALVVGLITTMVVLVAGTVVSLSQAVRAGRAERLATQRLGEAELARAEAENRQREAERQANISAAVVRFLKDDLLAAVDPGQTPNPQISMREVVDAAAGRVEGAFDAQPAVEASIQLTVGETYQNLGLFDRAEVHLSRGLELSRRVYGETHAATLSATGQFGHLRQQQGQFEEAEKLLTGARETSLRTLGAKDDVTRQLSVTLGALYLSQGRYEEAEPLYLAILEEAENSSGDAASSALAAMNNLGALYGTKGRFADAARLLRKVAELSRKAHGGEHPETISALFNVANTFSAQGKYAEAEPILKDVLEAARRVLGDKHPTTLRAMHDLAISYNGRGAREEAIPLLEQSLSGLREAVGEDHPDTLRSMNTLAGLYLLQGRLPEAEPLYAASLENRRRVLGEDHLETAVSRATLAALYNKLGRYDAAEPLLVAALSTARAQLSPGHYYVGAFLRYYGDCLTGLRKFAEAERALEESYEILEGALGGAHEQTQGTVKLLVKLHEAGGHPDRADEWKRKLSTDGRAKRGE